MNLGISNILNMSRRLLSIRYDDVDSSFYLNRGEFINLTKDLIFSKSLGLQIC